MFDQVDREIRQWIGSVLGGVPVSLEPPSARRSGPRGVSAYLLRVEPAPPARGPRRPPVQASLHYLIAAWGETPEEAHALLGRLYVAAAERPGVEIDPNGFPEEAWGALGIPPQPSLLLKVLFRHERPEKQAPRVREPMVLRHVPAVPLQGKVVGPGGIPIMGAHVEIPELRAATVTDSDGAFRFAALPTGKVRSVRILAKGKEFSVDAEASASNGSPLVIRLSKLLEE